MRPGYYEAKDGTIIDGHWHHKSINAGEYYQSRKTDQWFIVESVIHTNNFQGDGNNWFCQIRPATQAEIDAKLKPNPVAEKQLFSDFFDAIDN